MGKLYDSQTALEGLILEKEEEYSKVLKNTRTLLELRTLLSRYYSLQPTIFKWT